MRHNTRRIDIGQELKDFLAAYTVTSKALKDSGLFKEKEPHEIKMDEARTSSPGIAGLSALPSPDVPARTAPAPQTQIAGVGAWWTPERMKQAADYLQQNAGLSKMGASGLVARWAAIEAPGGPESVNPKSNAFGIAQWLGPRLSEITGVKDFNKQLEYAAKELNTSPSEKAAAETLRGAKTADDAARGASMFERAEGFDPKTGLDNFSSKTPAQNVFDQLYGAQQTPPAQDTVSLGGAGEGDNVQSFAGGGFVGQRPDRVANPIPGVAALPVDAGTRPGGARTAARAISPGYVDGGSVDEEDTGDQVAGQDTGAYAATQPSLQGVGGNILNGLGDALHGALGFIADTFGFRSEPYQQPGAVPAQHGPGVMDGLHQLLSGHHAASSAEYNSVLNAVDPDKELDEGLRNAAAINAGYRYFTEKGEPDKAKKFAASLVMHLQWLAAQYGDRAAQYIRAGKGQEGVDELARGFETVPTGTSMAGRANPDGSADLTETDSSGKVVNKFRVSQQQLLAAAIGMKNGTGYYNSIMEAAGKKPEEEPSEAFKQWQQGAIKPQVGAQQAQAQPTLQATSQTAQTALPIFAQAQAPTSGGITPEGNAPQQAALPAPAAAAAAPLQLPPPPAPPDPALLRQMKSEEQQFAIRQFKAELSDWRAHVAQLKTERAESDRAALAARTETFRQNQENLRQARAHAHETALSERQLNAPLSIGERHQAEMDVASALEEYKKVNPDESMSPHVMSGIRNIAGRIYMTHRNNITSADAVEAALGLSKARNTAIDDVKVGPNGFATVPLSDGSSLQIDQPTLNAVQTLRAKNAKSLKDAAEAAKSKFIPRATRALGTAAQGAGEYLLTNRPVPNVPLSTRQWMQGMWNAYKNATGEE